MSRSLCCKFAAIIRDGSGADKEGALDILNAGLAKYGATNSELVRAKAKVYYRAGEHADSLNLSRSLIEKMAKLRVRLSTHFLAVMQRYVPKSRATFLGLGSTTFTLEQQHKKLPLAI